MQPMGVMREEISFNSWSVNIKWLLYRKKYPVSCCAGIYNLKDSWDIPLWEYQWEKISSAVKEAACDSLPTGGYGDSLHVKGFHRVADAAWLIPSKRILTKHIANVSVAFWRIIRSGVQRRQLAGIVGERFWKSECIMNICWGLVPPFPFSLIMETTLISFRKDPFLPHQPRNCKSGYRWEDHFSLHPPINCKIGARIEVWLSDSQGTDTVSAGAHRREHSFLSHWSWNWGSFCNAHYLAPEVYCLSESGSNMEEARPRGDTRS